MTGFRFKKLGCYENGRTESHDAASFPIRASLYYTRRKRRAPQQRLPGLHGTVSSYHFVPQRIRLHLQAFFEVAFQRLTPDQLSAHEPELLQPDGYLLEHCGEHLVYLKCRFHRWVSLE
jgi:hypothetical protein